MDKLTKKVYLSYNYTCRYTGVPSYYDTEKQRDVYGIGEQMLKNIAYVSHKVVPEDTLDSLALNYYNNPSYWWIIAYFNDIPDPFIDLHKRYTTLKIPSISSIEFKNER